MQPFEMETSSAAGADILNMVSTTEFSLPYKSAGPNDCGGFVTRLLFSVDKMLSPRKLSPVQRGIRNRVLYLRGWIFWFVGLLSILVYAGNLAHTMHWLMRDPVPSNTKAALYLDAVSLIWVIEQIFCFIMRPVMPLRSMLGYIHDWSHVNCYVPKLFCAFATLVYVGNVVYGSISEFSTLDLRDCIPSQSRPFSALYSSIENCTDLRGSKARFDSVLALVAQNGQQYPAQPASAVFSILIFLIATLVWTTTPLQFAVTMLFNVRELGSARRMIDSELLDTGEDSKSAESVLKRAHAHIVAADIGSCRCNEVFGIVVAGNLLLDFSLIATMLSALQDPLYQQDEVLVPVSVFWMTAGIVHICAFFLPIAAYNANLGSIQTSLYRYSARLNGLTTPADNWQAWAQPHRAGLLKRLHHKVCSTCICL